MYERFYQLKARPFQLMPDPRRLYQTPSHDRGLSYLIYGLERGEGFVVVTGAVGTGKTLLVQVLLGEISTRGLSIARVAMANASAETVVASVASAFGVSVRGLSKVELLDALVARLSGGRHRRGLLMVDEAQACSHGALEELRLLSNLQANGEALIQVVLVGQSELLARLQRPDMTHLRQRIVASFHLAPLRFDEVPGYIEHRLQSVGWKRNKLDFSDGVYARVHAWSDGIPRRINQIMDRLLLLGFLEERRELGVADLDTAIEEFEAEFGATGLVYDAVPDLAPGTHDAAPTSELVTRLDELEARLAQIAGTDILHTQRSRMAERELAAARVRLDAIEDLVRRFWPADDEEAATGASERSDPETAGDDASRALLSRLFGGRGDRP